MTVKINLFLVETIRQRHSGYGEKYRFTTKQFSFAGGQIPHNSSSLRGVFLRDGSWRSSQDVQSNCRRGCISYYYMTASMKWQWRTYHKQSGLNPLILRGLHHTLNSKTTLKTWTHGQTVQLLHGDDKDEDHLWNYSVARALYNVTAWQSVNAVCIGCLTHGACACVGHWTPDYGAMEAQNLLLSIGT